MDDNDAKVESSESERVKLIRLDSAGRSRQYDAMLLYIYLSLILLQHASTSPVYIPSSFHQICQNVFKGIYPI